jgi:imidazolonepropionase-like amidohydrolase
MQNPLCRTIMLFLLAFMASSPISAASLAIVNGTVIDGTGSAPLKNAVVVIDGDRIAAVGAAGKVTVPPDAEVIDAKGKYLIPGLMDANVHLFFGTADLALMYQNEGRYHEMIIEAAQIALKSGQTTVYDTWGPRAALVQARDLINSGEAIGSRIFHAGNIIGFDGPYSDDFMPKVAEVATGTFVSEINEMWQQGVGRELMWLTPEEVTERVREYATKDVDFLKYGASGHQLMFFIGFSPRVQKAIVDEGHRAGMTVQAHTSSPESLDLAIEAGVDIATHCDITGLKSEMPPETIRKMVDRGTACSILPLTQARLKFLVEKMPNSPVTPYHEIAEKNIRNMIKAGVSLLMSTDAGIFSHEIEEHYGKLMGNLNEVDPSTKLGEGHFNALVALEEMGMSPMEILKSATSNIARAYKNDADLGTLEAGKFADLVILDKDPLKDARNYRSIHTVVKSGQVVDLDALPTKPIVTADWVDEASNPD